MWILKQAFFVVLVGVALYFVSKRFSTHPILRHEMSLGFRRHLLIASVLWVFLVPTVILGHEAGHWLAGKACNLDVVLHHDQVRFRKPPDWNDHSSQMLLFTIGGPVVELSLATIGICGLWRFRQRTAAAVQPLRFWIFSLFTLSGLRWLRFNLVSPSDETLISRALGFPSFFVAGIMLVPAVFAAWLVVDTHRTQGTIAPLLCSIPLGVASALFYLNIVGPAVFHAWGGE